MKKLWLILLASSLTLTAPGLTAKDDKGKHTGAGSSLEHKSETGLEHGKAYAGEKEKKLRMEDKGKHLGDGKSLEHKSETGLEHGKAYAGEKEKKAK